jgi:hypothetical protein
MMRPSVPIVQNCAAQESCVRARARNAPQFSGVGNHLGNERERLPKVAHPGDGGLELLAAAARDIERLEVSRVDIARAVLQHGKAEHGEERQRDKQDHADEAKLDTAKPCSQRRPPARKLQEPHRRSPPRLFFVCHDPNPSRLRR